MPGGMSVAASAYRLPRRGIDGAAVQRGGEASRIGSSRERIAGSASWPTRTHGEQWAVISALELRSTSHATWGCQLCEARVGDSVPS